MKITHATTTSTALGPLSQRVLKYAEMIEDCARGEGQAIDWDPLAEFVATEDFVRVGAYQEVMNWREYLDFMQEWAGTTRFESTIFRLSEVGQVVVQEIEERHYKDDDFIRKNVVALYEFDDDQKIRHLDIYEQAKDSGQWIIEAAHRSR